MSLSIALVRATATEEAATGSFDVNSQGRQRNRYTPCRTVGLGGVGRGTFPTLPPVAVPVGSLLDCGVWSSAGKAQ